MPIISYMGEDFDSPNIQVQDNGSATDLDDTKVPTGRTVESYINSKTQDNTSATDLDDYKLPTGRTIENYLNSKLTWNLLYSSYIYPSATGQSFTPTVSFSKVHEVLVSLVYNGASYRQSFVFVYDIARRSGMVFPDFYFAGARLYCSVLLNTSTGKIEIGSGGNSGSVVWGNGNGQCALALFYR